MIVLVSGIPNEVNSFSMTIDDDHKTNWTRFKIALADKIKDVIDYDLLMKHYFPLFIMNEIGIVASANDLARTNECVVLPRGSLLDNASTELANFRDGNQNKLNWSQCQNSFRSFDEYSDEIRDTLCNLNFKQIGFGIVKCQTCQVPQKLENFFLPIMTQHAIASPSCPNLDIWNGKLIISPSVFSTWAQELTCKTIKEYKEASFSRLIRSRALVPDTDISVKMEMPLCNICYTNFADLLYLPCLHYNTCSRCHSSKQNNTCQTCHLEVQITTKIFS